MTVAWIGNRDALVQHAVGHAAELLAASRCPVISIDADIDGTRAAIGLAERVRAAYDHLNGDALAAEVALLRDSGGMFVAAGEVRRRADLVVIVGTLPHIHHEYVRALAETPPDLSENGKRAFFLVPDGGDESLPAGLEVPVTRLACDGADMPAVLAAIRAQYAGRRVSKPVTHFKQLSKALEKARYAAFLCSGNSSPQLSLEMLQGIVSDINKKMRAAALMLPESEAGWGSTLASGWTSGFPMRTGFARGVAEHDPWRWDVRRMLEAGEADVHLWIATREEAAPAQLDGVQLIALTKTAEPVTGAAVTIQVGEPGADHDAVVYSSRRGTLVANQAATPSQLPSATSIVKAIMEHLPDKMDARC